MKTPKEKAKDLVNQYDEALTYLESKAKAKQCALIAVEELIKNSFPGTPKNYWEEVKQEIENL